MAPKAKYTKEMIINSAFELVREQGISALSARSLAKKMNASSQPIFTYFNNMEEVKAEVIKKAKEVYRNDYILEGLKMNPPFKGVGIKYIDFAIKDRMLFELLFMSKNDETSHYLPSFDDNAKDVEKVLVKSYHLSLEDSKELYNLLSIFVHGIATLFARESYILTEEDASNMLTTVFMALTKYMKEGRVNEYYN